jgi:hypothetical protein
MALTFTGTRGSDGGPRGGTDAAHRPDRLQHRVGTRGRGDAPHELGHRTRPQPQYDFGRFRALPRSVTRTASSATGCRWCRPASEPTISNGSARSSYECATSRPAANWSGRTRLARWEYSYWSSVHVSTRNTVPRLRSGAAGAARVEPDSDVMLFCLGYWLGQHGGYHPGRTSSTVLLGLVLVGIAIALGG